MVNNFVPPGAVPAQQLSSIYVDGMPLDALNTALRLEQQALAGQRHEPAQRFWSSARRLNGDTTLDVFEVDLNTVHVTNNLSFELAHFPQKCEVQYFDPASSLWVPVPNVFREDTQIVIRESQPALIPLTPASGQHPFHFGQGHWTKYDLSLTSIETSRFRLVFSRLSGGGGPVNSQGVEVPYPLGVRNFLVGYKVREKNDVPLTRDSFTRLTERDYFASATDMLGSSTQFHFRENRATDLLRGGRWKSEPMPVPYAVIPFYVDMRDVYGDGQLVDRFYLEPLYPNSTVSIYSSDDSPATTFDAVDAPLPFSAVTMSSLPVVRDQNGLDFQSTPTKVEISNAFLQFDPKQNWWAGFQVTPHDTGDVALMSAGDDIIVAYTAGTWLFVYGDTTVSVSHTNVPDQAVKIVASVTNGVPNLYVQGTSTTNTVADTVISPLSVILSSDLHAQNFLLSSFVLKPVGLGPTDLTDYTDDPMGYVLKSPDRSAANPRTDNSLLRFAPEFLTDLDYPAPSGETVLPGLNASGLVGGPGSIYDGLVWTPVARDFTLRKGEYYIPPTKAKFFKFEFTNLCAQTYEMFVPMQRTVKTFSTDATQRLQALLQAPNYTVPYGGAKTNADLTTILRYSDGLRYPPSIDTGADYSPTETFYHEDPSVVAQLRAKNPYLGFVNQRGPVRPPMNPTISQHLYDEIDVRHATKVAYFVGLNALAAYRVNHHAEDDMGRFIDLFYDSGNLHFDDWAFSPGNLTTPGAGKFSVVSATFNSRRTVRGVQFASVQTPPVQLLSDPEFARVDANGDPDLSLWDSMGDALALQITDAYTTDIGTAVLVTRSGTFNPLAGLHIIQPPGTTSSTDVTYQQMTTKWKNWLGLEGANTGGSTTFAFFETYTTTDLPPPIIENDQPYVPGGIVGVQQVVPSGAGRIYASCRVIAPQKLHDNLYLQIVPSSDPHGTTVLAEIAFQAHPGAITEEYVGWRVPDTFSGAVCVRLIEKAETGDSWVVDNISIYEESIVWEFSRDGGTTWYEVVDIRNDPHGVFLFPPLPAGDTTNGRQLCYRVTGYRENLHLNSVVLRPWYVGLRNGISPREEPHNGGPNTSMRDHYMPIEDDPYFHLWHKPVPIDWWYFYKRFLLIQSDQIAVTPVIRVGIFLSDDLVVFPNVLFTHDDWLIFGGAGSSVPPTTVVQHDDWLELP